MSTPNLPWLPGYTPPVAGNIFGDLVNTAETVTQDATQVATGVGAEVAGAIAGPTAAEVVKDVGGVAQGVEQAGGAVIGAVTGIPTATPTPSASIPPGLIPSAPVTGLSTDILSTIETAATSSAKSAVLAVLPDLKGALEHLVEEAVAAKLESAATKDLDDAEGGTGPGDIPVPSVNDFIKADARSRAIRTLVIGVVLSVGWGAVNAIGALSGVNWFDSHVWPSMIALVTGSVVTSVTSYIARLAKEPPHTAPVVAALAATSPKGGK